MKPALPEAERVRARIRAWREFAEEMQAMRARELRALTETEAARIADQISLPPAEIHRRPATLDGRGLVEQQRLFMKGHGHRPA